MSDNEYWDACAKEEAAMHEKDNELIPRGEARKLAYEIFNHFMLMDFLQITPADIAADIDEKVAAISAVPQEMGAREYGETLMKICASHTGECRKCELGENKPCAIPYKRTIPIVEAWAREHPERSEE